MTDETTDETQQEATQIGLPGEEEYPVREIVTASVLVQIWASEFAMLGVGMFLGAVSVLGPQIEAGMHARELATFNRPLLRNSLILSFGSLAIMTLARRYGGWVNDRLNGYLWAALAWRFDDA